MSFGWRDYKWECPETGILFSEPWALGGRVLLVEGFEWRGGIQPPSSKATLPLCEVSDPRRLKGSCCCCLSTCLALLCSFSQRREGTEVLVPPYFQSTSPRPVVPAGLNLGGELVCPSWVSLHSHSLVSCLHIIVPHFVLLMGHSLHSGRQLVQHFSFCRWVVCLFVAIHKKRF